MQNASTQMVDVPAGKRVLILNGPHRDTEAVLEGIDEKNFSATLTLDSVSYARTSVTSASVEQQCSMENK